MDLFRSVKSSYLYPMRSIVVIYFCAFGCLSLSCQSTTRMRYSTEAERLGIYGPVERIVTYIHQKYETESRWRPVQKSVKVFNQQGNLIYDTLYDLVFGDANVQHFTYSSEGALLSTMGFIDGKKNTAMLCRYDGEGKLTRADIFDGNDKLSDYYQVEELHGNGEMKSARHYSAAGKLLNSLHHKYEGNVRVSEVYRDRKDSIYESYHYTLTKNKWRSREIYTSILNGVSYSDTTFYDYASPDHAGNWQEMITVASGSVVEKKVRSFSYYQMLQLQSR